MASILIVDNSASDFAQAQGILSYAGYQLTHCPDAEAVCGMVRTHRPALILLNTVLSGKSFLAVMRDLRASSQTADVPIALTGTDDPTTLQSLAASQGAKDYIRKPYDFNQLLEVVAKSVG